MPLVPLTVLRRQVDTIRSLAEIFPPTSRANRHGALCLGGDLSLPLLLAAYSRGIFPWFSPGDPVMWWSPDPRCVMLPERYHMPRRAARTLRKMRLRITLDAAFERVLDGCADREETWLSADMKRAYITLHEAGFAHSIEAWQGSQIVGGLYGLALGRAFFGESMFHTVSEASRACLAALNQLLILRGIRLLDCQQETPHIMAQGGMLIPRTEFEARLKKALALTDTDRDALTLEYGGSPLERAYGWPFLPWRSIYVHENGEWRDSSGNGRPWSMTCPRQTHSSAETDPAPSTEAGR